MARTRPPQPAPLAPTGFLASAVRLPTASRNMAGRVESWQTKAWEYWESVGELRYVSTWIGNVMSRAILVPARRQGRMLEPVARGPAVDAMDALYGGPQGQTEMLQGVGVHLTVAGESYVTNRAKGDAWNTLASGKVRQLPGGKLSADFGTEGGKTELGPEDLVIRIWTPHPHDPTRADSPVRASLATLGQIVSYDAHIAAQVRSRLAGNGILFISSEVEFPPPPNAPPGATSAQNFMAMLGEAMLTPISDPGDPSALVPIVAMVPTESLGKNEHVKFWSDLDNAVIEMRDAAIKRLALGIDVPPEVLLGVADSNHWNAWLSEETAVKAHLEPRLAIVAYALTTAYLRPALEGQVADPEDYYVMADTSSIRLRPNRSTEAIELYDRGELSGAALRRETGFQPEDAPEAAEMERWLLHKLVTGATSPELAQAAVRLLGIKMDVEPLVLTPQQPADHTRTDVAPNLPQHNPPSEDEGRRRANRLPAKAKVPGPGLAAACDVLVFRALERAGNRLRNAHPRTDTTLIAATEVYKTLAGDPDKLLDGAWDCASGVLAPYTADPTEVIDVLDFYVRGLLASHRPHSATVLGALLAAAPGPLPALEPA